MGALTWAALLGVVGMLNLWQVTRTTGRGFWPRATRGLCFLMGTICLAAGAVSLLDHLRLIERIAP